MRKEPRQFPLKSPCDQVMDAEDAFHSTNLFRKTGGPKCGFPVPKDGLEGPRDWVTTHLQKTSIMHNPNPPKSFPQAGEALSLGSQKMCCNFRRSGPTSISLEPEYSNNISWLVVRMLAWYADISTSCRSTASIDAAISLHMFSIVLSSRSIFPNSSQQLDSFDSTTLTA